MWKSSLQGWNYLQALSHTSNTSAPKRRRTLPSTCPWKAQLPTAPAAKLFKQPFFLTLSLQQRQVASGSCCLITVVLGRSIESPFEVRILWEIARVSSESFCFWPGSPFGSGNQAGHSWSGLSIRFVKTESGQTSVQELDSSGSRTNIMLDNSSRNQQLD